MKTTTTQLHTVTEAARILGLCKRSIGNQVAAGKLGFVKIGRSIRFRAEELERFIAAHEVKPKGWKQPKAINIRPHVG
jgi:excisionase family DNA binding protein